MKKEFFSKKPLTKDEIQNEKNNDWDWVFSEPVQIWDIRIPDAEYLYRNVFLKSI